MTRKLVVTLTLGVSVLCMLACRRRGAARPPSRSAASSCGSAAQQEQTAPNSAAIAEALGDLHWGMEPQRGPPVLREQDPRALPASGSRRRPGTIEEDRIRHEMDDEIRRLRESYVRFDGDRTGWDLSFLRGEFTHGNRESMLVYRDENSQNFYFFIQGRLWKWYKAFDASRLPRARASTSSRRRCRAASAPRPSARARWSRADPQQHWLEWQDPTTRLRAIDQTRFYGFYCLVFEDKWHAVAPRSAPNPHDRLVRPSRGHALVDSVTLPEGGEENVADGNADIVDRITGHIRRRPARGEGDTATARTAGGRRRSSGPSSEPSHDSGHSSSGSSDRTSISRTSDALTRCTNPPR